MGRGGDNSLDTDAILYGRWRVQSRPALEPIWSQSRDLWSHVEANGQSIHRLESGDREYVYWMNNDRFEIEYKIYSEGREIDAGQIALPGSPTAIYDFIELSDGRIMASWEAEYRKVTLGLVDFEAPIEALVDPLTHFDPIQEKQAMLRGKPVLLSNLGDRFEIRSALSGRHSFSAALPEGLYCQEVLDIEEVGDSSQILVRTAGEEKSLVVLSDDPASPYPEYQADHFISGKSISSLAAFVPGHNEDPPLVIARDEGHALFAVQPGRERIPIPGQSGMSPRVRAERAEDGSVIVHWRNIDGDHLVRISPDGDPEVVEFGRRFEQVSAMASGERIELFWLEGDSDGQILMNSHIQLDEFRLPEELPREILARSSDPETMLEIDQIYTDKLGNTGVIWTENSDPEDMDPVFSVRRNVRR